MSQFFARLTPKQKQCLATIQTPYYLLDERAIIDNLSITQKVCHESGAKALLALKCFATWGFLSPCSRICMAQLPRP
ncbi:carboxynorspermidine decarboxylase [Moraxella catarrhalis]|nr:carboxynorspermidine decarboxylase [Moraxella catarrhalis]